MQLAAIYVSHKRDMATRAWRMLTGGSYEAGALSAEQIQRVEVISMVDHVVQESVDGSGGAWMMPIERGAVFAGAAPADYLTKLGKPGCAGLLRQVLHWRDL